MYRRDISHILRLLGVLLSGFVLYQVWIKPTFLVPPAPPFVAPSTAQPASSGTIPAAEHVAPPDVPQTRLIDPGDAPISGLAQIRDDLDRGNYKAVESSLQKFPAKILATERAKQYVAALWNNLGIQQEKYGGIDVSVKAFKKAVALDPKNPTALLNLTQAYWGLRDKALTPEFLQTVIRSAPKDPFPHLALADILIDRGNATAASQHLKTVEMQASTDPNLQAYFRQLTAKLGQRVPSGSRSIEVTAAIAPKPPQEQTPSPVKESSPTAPPPVPQSGSVQTVATASPLSEPPAEATVRAFKPRSAEHFIIRFDGKESADLSMQIRSILEYAHQEMSQKFGHVPATSIHVVLHTEQKFANIAGSPAWADSLYDATTATIHIPMEGALDDLALLSRVVRHEFAHALIQDKMGMRTNSLPAWLAEGLAMQLAEDPWPDLEEIKQKTMAVIPLPRLQQQWTLLPKESWTVAYVESMAATQNLVDRYSMYGVRQVMNAIQLGQSLDGAMQQKLSISYDQFQRTWEEHYKSFLRSRNS